MNRKKEPLTGFNDFLKGTDEIGTFWVVTLPVIYGGETKSESVINDICFESTILGVANQVRGGLDDRNGQIYGFYRNENKAKKVAQGLLNKKDKIYYKGPPIHSCKDCTLSS